MNILVIGSGGREHALAWKASQSPLSTNVFVAPGNAGTANTPGVENVQIDALDIDGLLAFAVEHRVALTIVGPEAPLVAGIVDTFAASSVRCFGPRQAAARLEGSKGFAKGFLSRHGIPTAAYQRFDNARRAIDYLHGQSFPVVIKADGLAAGKGVVIAQSLAEARNTITDMLEHHRFGAAGKEIVIEEFLPGEEVSFICMVSGTDVLVMATSQDHKAAGDGDIGPNTGGMGAYSPAPMVDQALHKRIMDDIVMPTVNGLKQDGIDYCGVLYAGLMIEPGGNGQVGIPRVLEFNCRFGDPETQPIMLRMESDLVAHCIAACDGALAGEQALWRKDFALGVVLAAHGYPDTYEKGHTIDGLDIAVSAKSYLFHAGTIARDARIVTDGGRVLCATALGANLSEAQSHAYSLARGISFDGCWYRRDIGRRALTGTGKI